jgi:transcriptional regulator
MFVPTYYQQDDINEIKQFIREHPFGTMISNGENAPWATHIPFYLKEEADGKLFLYSHFHKGNHHKNLLFQPGESLFIFKNEGSYISTRLYEGKENAPTWNYMAVHCYGKVSALQTRQEQIDMLEGIIKTIDADYLEQWNNLSTEYIDRLLKALVAFKVEITRFDAQWKLSQDKNPQERHNIIDYLKKSNSTHQHEIAKHMKP